MCFTSRIWVIQGTACITQSVNWFSIFVQLLLFWNPGGESEGLFNLLKRNAYRFIFSKVTSMYPGNGIPFTERDHLNEMTHLSYLSILFVLGFWNDGKTLFRLNPFIST